MRLPRTLAGRRVAVTGAGGFIGTHLSSRVEEAAAAGDVSFVAFASTAEVYPTSGLNREDGPLAPRSPYAVAKLVQEELVRAWAADTRRPAAVLRLTTVYGPGEAVRRAVPRFI